MPYGFIDSGGGKSDFMAFAFFILIVICYVLEGMYQKVSLVTLIAVFILLHILDYLHPELIPVYDPKIRFYDRLILVPVMMLLTYSIIKIFAKTYSESNNKLYYCANYDMLTGLLNRWGFTEMLSKRVNTSGCDGQLLLIDIDNFKLINDHQGHKIGDEVLKRLGSILGKYFSDNRNLVCRWGGDEFIILFFDGEEKLDKLMENATHDFLSFINDIEPLVDISIGSASVHDCSSVEQVFIKSDQLMYEQKNSKKS